MRHPLRIAFLVVLVGAAFACGLDVLGGAPPSDQAGDGGPESGTLDQSSTPPDARDEGNEIELDGGLDGEPPLDLDAAQQKCLGLCEAGTCEAGTCKIDCSGSNACNGATVTCPPGIPCGVTCVGSGVCSQGVDCMGSTACSVVCNGSNACANAPVACSGSQCSVACNGSSSCSQGIVCDAGRCDLSCRGSSSCANAPVTCTSNVCNVRCGDGGDDGRGVCAGGVDCTARYACNVDCISRESCTNNAVVVLAGDAATVHCVRDSCRAGIEVNAGDASISCTGQDSCINQPILCDGGNCVASCNGSNPTFCCGAPTKCTERENGGCNFTTTGCP
ncbi:MAG: hypothetical protein JST00_19765 [Deltaproteobacteria bacterium]|nr:hypothetical protein [Deltaproteobacteria bacterium]